MRASSRIVWALALGIVAAALGLGARSASLRSWVEALRVAHELRDPRAAWTERANAAAVRLLEIEGERAWPAILDALEVHARTPPPDAPSLDANALLTALLEEGPSSGGRDPRPERLAGILERLGPPAGVRTRAADLAFADLFGDALARLRYRDRALAAEAAPAVLDALDARAAGDDAGRVISWRRIAAETAEPALEASPDLARKVAAADLALQRLRFEAHAQAVEDASEGEPCLLFLETPRVRAIAPGHELALGGAGLLLDGGDVAALDFATMLVTDTLAGPSLLDCSDPRRCPLAIARAHGARRAALAIVVEVRRGGAALARGEVRSGWLDVGAPAPPPPR